MRVKITLKGDPDLLFPFNYNHILASIIYNKFDDMVFSSKLHDSKDYKYFTFSSLFFNNCEATKEGLISRDGCAYFFVSSCDDFLIKRLLSGLIDNMEVVFKGQVLKVVSVELLSTPDFDSICSFKTISPILVRRMDYEDGKKKIHDLCPSDEFFERIVSNLKRKYVSYYGLDGTDKYLSVGGDIGSYKSKRISIKWGSNQTFNRAYLMDLTLYGDEDLIEFAYDTGLGGKNSMGFGMIEVV